MSHLVFNQIAEELAELVHLAVHELQDGELEVVAIREAGEWRDAFPLPFEVQSAAAEAGVNLDTSTVARVELTQFPADFWKDETEVKFGARLTVTFLGSSARKYLRVYRAVRTESVEHLGGEAWSPSDLAKVAKWLRDERLFDHRSGPAIMAALGAGPNGI
ncbi:MAG: hypothetical protein QNL33_13390 [Akkermansiaceae bacterium]|jgi:hypothetical protein